MTYGPTPGAEFIPRRVFVAVEKANALALDAIAAELSRVTAAGNTPEPPYKAVMAPLPTCGKAGLTG